MCSERDESITCLTAGRENPKYKTQNNPKYNQRHDIFVGVIHLCLVPTNAIILITAMKLISPISMLDQKHFLSSIVSFKGDDTEQ